MFLFHAGDYPSGVQLNYPVSQLQSFGCSLCYQVSYGTATTLSNINGCTGPYIFVGALASSSSANFVLGAFAPQTSATTQTARNQPNLINGVYWYCTSGYSFGFSDVYSINQDFCDFADLSDRMKLCWHIGGGGGYRAGNTIDLNSNTIFQKVLYNCAGAQGLFAFLFVCFLVNKTSMLCFF